MKIKKLLLIMMMMNDEFCFDSFEEEDKKGWMNRGERFYKEIQMLEKTLSDMGIDYAKQTPKLREEKGSVVLKVVDENGHGMSAQVKFFPLAPDETLETFSKVNHRIDMILKQADIDGQLSVALPCYGYSGFEKGHIESVKISRYVMEVSRGSEYEVINSIVEVDEGSSLNIECCLHSLVNLREMGWYAGDLHHHSIYSSPTFGGTDDVIESAREVMIAMTSMGLSFGALSDHHNILNHEDWMSTKTESFLPIPSKEISTSNGHVMSLNVLDDVIYDIPSQEDRTDTYLYNEFIRIVDEIKSQGGLAQINHPKDVQPAISLSKNMKDHIQIFDTIEIWNGSIPMLQGTTNYSAFEYWLSLLHEDKYIPATTGSDTHNTRADDYHEMLDHLLWLKHHVTNMESQHKGVFEDKKEVIEHFVQVIDNSIDSFELWAEETLGTAGVRTYIHVDAPLPLTPEKVLEALRGGRSFLTNGPIVLPEVEGKSCGETFILPEATKAITLTCSFLTQRPIKALEIIGKNGLIASIDLMDEALNKMHHIEIEIERNKLHKEDWLICKLGLDHTNLAITNPIFIRQ